MTIASLLAKKGVKIVTIGPEDTIRQAVGRLAEHNIGALVVVDGQGGLTGIVSERDIVRALARSEAPRTEAILAQPVAAIMTRNVVIGTPQDDLVAVGNTMTEHHIRHLPVVEGGHLVGIISIGDVVKAQRDQYQGEVDTLQFQILQDEDVR
jgi:CBS domain-containing protein